MSVLTAEEMAQIEGGEFLLPEERCIKTNVGAGCYVKYGEGVLSGQCGTCTLYANNIAVIYYCCNTETP